MQRLSGASGLPGWRKVKYTSLSMPRGTAVFEIRGVEAGKKAFERVFLKSLVRQMGERV